MTCPKCGGDVWEGPRFVTYRNDQYTRPSQGWPTSDSREYLREPLPEALMFQCSCCGFKRFQRTVADGGPIAAPQPSPATPAPKD